MSRPTLPPHVLRLTILSQRLLALLLVVFSLAQAWVYADAPVRGTVAYMVSLGFPTTALSLWSALAAGAALLALLFAQYAEVSVILLLFAIAPGLFYTYQTYEFIAVNAANATPMVVVMDAQLYAILTCLLLWVAALRFSTRDPGGGG